MADRPTLPTREAAQQAVEILDYWYGADLAEVNDGGKALRMVLAIAEWALSLRAATDGEAGRAFDESPPLPGGWNGVMAGYRAAERALLPPWANEGGGHAER